MSGRNKKGRDINGIVLLDKDTGLSSNAALQKVKKLFFAKKAGHTGSLDPLASGILPICLGQSTKVAGLLLDDDKRYFVRARLGQVTSTGDCEGELLSSDTFDHISEKEIISTVNSFVGQIEQIPPMYSALKRDGIPLYKLARQGIEVERKPRKVTIHDINYINYSNGTLALDVKCSKGTYIRTLVEDIGNTLGCGAHVIELRRTGFAKIDISQTVKFSDLQDIETDDFRLLDKKIYATEDILPTLQSIFLDSHQSIDIKFGRKITYTKNIEPGLVKMFDSEKLFIGIGKSQGDGEISTKRLFI